MRSKVIRLELKHVLEHMARPLPIRFGHENLF